MHTKQIKTIKNPSQNLPGYPFKGKFYILPLKVDSIPYCLHFLKALEYALRVLKACYETMGGTFSGASNLKSECLPSNPNARPAADKRVCRHIGVAETRQTAFVSQSIIHSKCYIVQVETSHVITQKLSDAFT